jgi:hypothetical protein
VINSLKSPVIQIESLKTKFDKVIVSNSLIALLEHNYEEARFLQQLHYWSYSEYGVVIDGIRWIYKSAKEWLSEALIGLTEWKLRKAIASLVEKKLIRREKLFTRHQKQEYRSFWWQPRNQTYYYSVNYKELQKLIEKVETVENIRFVESTKLSIEENKETKVCELSRNSTKITNHRKPTTKQRGDLLTTESNVIAAAKVKNVLKEEEKQKQRIHHSEELTAESGQNKAQSSRRLLGMNLHTQNAPMQIKLENEEERNVARVDCIINKDWKELIPELDGAGIPINKTVKSLLKLYPKEKVEEAIALLRARKREKHIPNVAGYFVSALKGEWGSKSLVENGETEVDTAAVFRHWYDLARELGYCSGQEIREGSQWICLSGAWEKWEEAVKRGYSLEYLKKIMKRNQGR